jgi:hypothetical protein
MQSMRSVIIILLTALAIPSCKPRHAQDAEKIEALRVQAEALIKAQSLMGWNSWAEGLSSNQDSLYKANAQLFTKENIDFVRQAETDEQDSVQRKRLWYFRRYLATEYISKAIAPLTDKVSNMESAAKVMFEGKEIPYRQVGGMIANEPKQERRAGLFLAVDPVLDSLNLIHTEIEQTNQQLAKSLGYTSYNAMAQEMKEISLDEFKHTAESVLSSTDSLYSTLLKETIGRYLKLTPEKFYRYDTAPLFRGMRFDKYFPESSMVDAVKATYSGLGVDIDGEKNLRIDSEKRPAKNPRAVCYAIEVPNDIRLSIKPIGGPDDYSGLFHEMGHGQHYANTKENAFEFKYLGEPTVTENFAFLSEYLLDNQAWLRLHTTMPTPVLKDFIRFQAFHRLFYIRRYSAKYLYELQLHQGVNAPQRIYADLQSRSTGFVKIPSDEKRYLADVDALYYSASYLRAWFLESQLNAKLSRDLGVNWFEHPQAGEYVRSLWANGDRLNGNEFVKLPGFDAITPDALLAEIQAMILFSTR